MGLYTSMSVEDFWMFAHARSLSFTTHESELVHLVSPVYLQSNQIGVQERTRMFRNQPKKFEPKKFK